MKTNLEYLLENKEKLKIKEHAICSICHKVKYGKYCDSSIKCAKCEFKENIKCCEFLNKEYKESINNKDPIEMIRFEYDLLMSYISIYKEGDRIFCTRPLLQKMFVLGCFVNVHLQLTLNEILERAVIVDAK